VEETDVGTAQQDRTGLSVADDGCLDQDEHVAGEPVRVQGWPGWVLEVASTQADCSQVSIRGDDAFLKKAIVQLEIDFRTEIRQVKAAGDPGPPKPQSMWIGIGREPPTQDFPDHGRSAGPSLTPRPHHGLVNSLILGG